MEQPVPQIDIDSPNAVQTRRRVLLWGALLSAAVLLLLLVFLLLSGKPTNDPQKGSSETTLTTAPEETTSPIPANPFAPDDFQLENGYLTCTAAESILGIDVSGYQKKIDWQQVKAAGIQFAIIRVGGRGWGTAGTLYADNYAQENYLGAKEAGIQVGVYFYSQAISVEEAREEANYVLALIKDWELDYPIVYDWEYVSAEARTAKMDARTLTDCTKAFCQTVENAGYAPMIYFNPSQSRDLLYLEELLEYPFGLAMYQNTLEYPHRVDMWQYTRTGTVPGIQGNVDINLYFPHNEQQSGS